MRTVHLTPDDEHQIPYDLEDDKTSSRKEELKLAAQTADLLTELGAKPDPETVEETASNLDEVIKNKKIKHLTNFNTAFAASAFLKTYGQNLALDVASTRAAITNKLMELANCGFPQYELKALELLGKIQDVALFTNRSEVTINYKNPAELETAIKERIKRLLNAEIIDVIPIKDTLDEDLGFATQIQEEKISDDA